MAMAATWPNIAVKAPRFADRLEAWGAASLFGEFKVLPLDCASALGGALARRIGPFLGVSKHARRNISHAFPELSEIEIARVVAGMWDNLGRLAAEYPHLRNITGSPEAVARPRFPQNVACGFPAPTLFGSWFTALQAPAAPGRGGAV